tara:strand:- start:331 stop:666 length:336 start_codon:yes stop_codon:yes gene_type:complete
MNISNKLQKLAEYNNFDIDLANLYYNEDTFNDFCDKVNDAIMQEEIIYYYEAMKYLTREDASLYQSLEIASEYGYTTDNLNSELLATLLYQQNLTNQWYEISEQVEEIFND